MELQLEVNGLSYVATYRDEDVEGVFHPLLKSWSYMRAELSRRMVLFLAAPPGTGKTTLALFLAALAKQMPEMPRVQALGMDGFHYPNSYLESHAIVEDGEAKLLVARKGAPFTFDVDALGAAFADVRGANPKPWPEYSRKIHDVVPAAIDIEGDILVIEGNYLLLDEPRWRDLSRMADQTVFLSASRDMLEGRLVGRKVAGGMNKSQAQAWYKASDGLNVELVLSSRVPSDVELELDQSGAIRRFR